jgi:hypothetical protein
MCEPTTIMMGISLAISAGMAVAQGHQQNKMQQANARIARQEAQQAEAIGAIEATRVRDRMRQQIGLQTAQLAARGAQLDSLTSLQLAGEAGEEAFLEEQASRVGTQSAANRLRQEGKMAEARGRLALAGGVATGASQLLQGGASMFGGGIGGGGGGGATRAASSLAKVA